MIVCETAAADLIELENVHEFCRKGFSQTKSYVQ